MKDVAGVFLGDENPELVCGYSVVPGCGEEVSWGNHLVRTTGSCANVLGGTSWPSHELCSWCNWLCVFSKNLGGTAI